MPYWISISHLNNKLINHEYHCYFKIQETFETTFAISIQFGYGCFWQEYIATKNIEFYEFNIDDYIDWIADLVIESSTSDDNSDNDPMLYSISETKNNKRVSYVFDSYNWIGNHEELYDIVLPVLDKLKFL